MQVTWKGPRRVVRAVSDLIYECQDLVTGKCGLFHANRLKFFCESNLIVSEDLLDAVQHNDPGLQEIDKILHLRFNPILERYELQIKWKGFEYEDPTWEPLSTMQEDVPELLNKFLDGYQNRDLVKAAKDSLAV